MFKTAKQSKAESRIDINPATRSVELFYLDQAYYGSVRPETVQAVIDEEKTMAAEDIARFKSRYAVVPRNYYQHGQQIIDLYGNDLKETFITGAEWADQEAAAGRPGSDWEAQRRWAEVQNVDRFIDMPAGQMMLEISASPDKPANELKEQGYTGMTYVRASAKVDETKIKQYNIILPGSGSKFLKDIQNLLGVPKGQEKLDTFELLANPLEMSAGKDISETIGHIENLCGAALLNDNPDKAVLQMIKKAAGAKKESWEFVDSANHNDLNSELAEQINELAKQNPVYWNSGIEQIRIGYMKELRERYDGKFRNAETGSIIDGAAAQAVADSDVFIVCGQTMETNSNINNTTQSNGEMARKLLKEVAGSGTCQACGAKGTLWGCGVFCGTCNKIWCAEYAKSGKELSYDQIRYLRQGKMADARQNSFVDELIESFAEWNRKYMYERELKRKQQEALSDSVHK